MKILFLLSIALLANNCENRTEPKEADQQNQSESSDRVQVKEPKGTYTIIGLMGEDVASMGKTFNFDNSEMRLSGKACNGYSGNYKIQGNSLILEPMVATKMFCEKLMDFENKLFTAFSEVRSYRFSENELQLMNSGGEILISATQN